MDFAALTAEQQKVVRQPLNRRVFLHGPTGCGKTTTGVHRVLHLVEYGVPGEQILVLAPTRNLALPYEEALSQPYLPPGGSPTIMTINGLARRMVDLFWPYIAKDAGFAYPERPPSFLTLETAQYVLSSLAEEYFRRGFFETVRIHRNRLYSQVIDNLNKAAAVGFEPNTISKRLKDAWSGKPGQEIVFDQVQELTLRYRDHCFKNNLLDFALQLEVLTHHLWPSPLVRQYLKNQYRHLVYENIEEDVPIAHDLVGAWLKDFDSALLIHDRDGGFRYFLGADPENALCLAMACDERVEWAGSFCTPSDLSVLETAVTARMLRQPLPSNCEAIQHLLEVYPSRFYPQMVVSVGESISRQIQAGCPASDIAILAPFVSDSLRFILQSELNRFGIMSRTVRPSRPLRSEAATSCLLTLAKLAHPQWNLRPSKQDIRDMLMVAIAGLDFIRADLLANLYTTGSATMQAFAQLRNDELRSRITYQFGGLYDQLRDWIEQYKQKPLVEMDLFLSRLFGEILSQPFFAFHKSDQMAEVAARLIESIQKFRLSLEDRLPNDESVGAEYIRVVEAGLLGATFLPSWEQQAQDAVLISPAYTFLMANRSVRHQYWLDIGCMGWWQRLDQPLTQPYVLSRRWIDGMRWTDANEVQTNQENLVRLVHGLVRRCSQEIHFYSVGINESGAEERGPLLLSLQGLLRQLAAQERNHD